MAKTCFYAIRRGRKPGIYTEWYGRDGAEAQIHKFSGAEYKKFNTQEEAKAFMEKGSGEPEKAVLSDGEMPAVYAFVDGSFNKATSVYGYGGFLVYDDRRVTLCGSDDDPQWAVSRNVAGEVRGAMAAISEAIKLGLPELTIYYDYRGIECWATGEWKANKTVSITYAGFISSVEGKIRLSFVHVAAHTGIPGNEEADKMAKKAAGLQVDDFFP